MGGEVEDSYLSGQRHPSAVYDIGGYVLAGGKSSRMGRDKALVELAGKPLVLRAVLKLRRICADVAIAGGDASLDMFAPVVVDIHPGCGPLSGIEAALAHSTHDWNLFLPIDMPLMPSAVLETCFVGVALKTLPALAAIVHTVDGRDQPLCAIYHRALLPFIQEALAAGRYKLMPVVREAARRLAVERKHEGRPLLWNAAYASDTVEIGAPALAEGTIFERVTPEQLAARPLWFANLNTPEDLALAAAHADALED